jgi:hypothetical protein
VPLPARGPGCPPAFALEALSAGEPPAPGVAEHAGACADCAGYLAALREGSLAFVRARPPELFLRHVAARGERDRGPWLRRLAWLLPAAAALAAVPFLATRIPEGDGVRERGAAFTVLRRRPGEERAERLAPDARVRAGESLRFAYDAPSDGQLLVLERDGTGATTVFFPWGGARSAPVAKGRAVLDGAVVLDAAPGPEQLVAVFSAEPLDAAALLAALGGADQADAVRRSCAGCRVDVLRLLKVP